MLMPDAARTAIWTLFREQIEGHLNEEFVHLGDLSYTLRQEVINAYRDARLLCARPEARRSIEFEHAESLVVLNNICCKGIVYQKKEDMTKEQRRSWYSMNRYLQEGGLTDNKYVFGARANRYTHTLSSNDLMIHIPTLYAQTTRGHAGGTPSVMIRPRTTPAHGKNASSHASAVRWCDQFMKSKGSNQ